MIMKHNLPDFVKYGRMKTLESPKDVKSLKGRDLFLFEKIDGGNCQVRLQDSWNLLLGSKAKYLKGSSAKRWPWFHNFMAWAYNNHSLYNLPNDVIVYGEWNGNHTITYDPDEIDRFFVLDVMKLPERRFLEYEEGKNFLTDIGVNDVRFLPIKGKGKLEERFIRNVLEEPSDFYGGPKEGVVIKDYKSEPQEFFRLYHPEFSEVLPRSGGKPDYLTIPRFRKNILVALEEGEKSKISEDEVVRYVTCDIERDERSVPGVNEVKDKLRELRDSGGLGDLARYIEDYSTENTESLRYVSSDRVMKIAKNMLQRRRKIPYEDLVREVNSDLSKRGYNGLSRDAIEARLGYLFKEGELRGIEQKVKF